MSAATVVVVPASSNCAY